MVRLALGHSHRQARNLHAWHARLSLVLDLEKPTSLPATVIVRAVHQVYELYLSESHRNDAMPGGHTKTAAELSHVRWVSHCRDLVQLPVAA
jgi:hypothetical protein